jgi:predicted metal-binding membrane protein
MTSTATERVGRSVAAAWPRPAASRAVLLVVAAGAWVATILWARSTGNGPGTMGLDLWRFVAMWALMMTAMMLPSVAAVAQVAGPSGLTPSERGAARGRRDTTETFVSVAGYLLIWAVTGLPAFGLAVIGGRLADHHPSVATGVAVAAFAVCGIYQLSGTKRRSLEHCRVPLTPGSSLATALRSGARYCGWCLACSGGATALMLALGVMNIAGMVILALVIYAERFVFRGRLFARLTGAAALAFGVLIVLSPSLAAGLQPRRGVP